MHELSRTKLDFDDDEETILRNMLRKLIEDRINAKRLEDSRIFIKAQEIYGAHTRRKGMFVPKLPAITRGNAEVVVYTDLKDRLGRQKKFLMVNQKGPNFRMIEKDGNADPLPNPYMYLEKSCIKLKSNVKIVPNFDEKLFYEVVEEGLKLIKNREDDDLETTFFELVQEYMNINHLSTTDLIEMYQKHNEAKKDCEQHTSSLKTLDMKNNNNIKTEFCSLDCFKLLKGKTNRFSPWTHSEEFLVKKAMLMYDSDYCAIALAVDSKTCSEIYKFAKDVRLPQRRTEKFEKQTTRSIYNQCEKRREDFKITLKSKLSDYPYAYQACDHDGKCNKECPCYKRNTFCERFCACQGKCQNGFPGCICIGQCDKKLCQCYMADRECDKQKCKCKSYSGGCSNMNLQFSSPKTLEIKPSTIEGIGYGAFATNNIENNEFIIEYTGELISPEESERRADYYYNVKLTYISNLYNDWDIDSFYIGNESRFINHSNNPNVYSKIVIISGERRLGLFANRRIKAGEELFFSYNLSCKHAAVYLGVNKQDEL